MVRKRPVLKKCLVATSLLVVVVIAGYALLDYLRILPAAELSREEVRHLFGGVNLPESLEPEAVRVAFSSDGGSFRLFMRIRVTGAQADKLLGVWLQEASRATGNHSSDPKDIWSSYQMYAGSALLPLRDDDIFVFKSIGEGGDAEFLLRKRDKGVDIYCAVFSVPWRYISKELVSVMRKGQGCRLGYGPGRRGERRLGEFGSD